MLKGACPGEEVQRSELLYVLISHVTLMPPPPDLVLEPAETPSSLTSLVPNQMSLMWSQMALAADMALDSFLALMTAAPRCCTVCRRTARRRRFEEKEEEEEVVVSVWRSAHRDEVSFEPGIVLHGGVGVLLGALDVDLGVVDVGVLGGGVVPPDDDVLHAVRGHLATHRHLWRQTVLRHHRAAAFSPADDEDEQKSKQTNKQTDRNKPEAPGLQTLRDQRGYN